MLDPKLQPYRAGRLILRILAIAIWATALIGTIASITAGAVFDGGWLLLMAIIFILGLIPLHLSR